MSSEIDLRVSWSLELLTRLKQTVTEFSAKEDQLQRELRTRRHAIERQYRETLEKLGNWSSTEVARTEANFQEASERFRMLFEQRRSRIQRAQASTIRNLPKRAKAAKEKWMGDLQMRKFRAERNQASGLEAVAEAFTKYNTRLAERRETFVHLEQQARKAFGGYGAFRRMLRRGSSEGLNITPTNLDHWLEQFQTSLQSAEAHLAEFRRLPLPRIFRFVPIAGLISVLFLATVVLAYLFGTSSTHAGVIIGAGSLLLTAVVLIFHVGKRQGKPLAAAIADSLAEASRLHDPCVAAAEAKRAANRQRVEDEYERADGAIRQQWDRAPEVEADYENALRKKIEIQVPRAFARNAAMLVPKLGVLETERNPALKALTGDAESKKEQLAAAYQADIAAFLADEKARWEALDADWKQEILPLFQIINAMNAETAAHFPAWNAPLVENWAPAMRFTPAAKFAQLNLDLSALAPPKETQNAQPPRLQLPGATQLSIPLALTFPQEGSLLFETEESSNALIIDAVNNIILRLLATTPPGKLSFTIIDPVGLGQNFAGLMHLSDYEESLINRRIWTQRDQIDDRLSELNEHIEKVIQMYLRNEYATITEYNAQAGSVSEKYHFLVVADFPANFSETAARRLQSIAVSGPRCGIFTLIHWDKRLPLPDGFSPDELRKNSVCIRHENGQFFLNKNQAEGGAALVFDLPPNPDLAIDLVHKIGKSSIDSNRVEVPFAQIAPIESEMWTLDTTNELRIAMGRTGATKLQYLAIGKGTRQHALFAGKTGSGKSTLFHVIITNLALACSPDQVEFYLIDFKKGVEFKCYASKRLPHARVIAIESDREFALSVLQRVDEELKRRGDLFRKLGVQDIAGYKRAGGTEPIPRSLLIIDEFQEFFVEDDAIAQSASLLFDRIVRQGRAFGIHVLLGSQSLGGAYSLARATIGQMVIRVALQCNEADAYLIMDDSNSAARLLSRPGEGIYNDGGGAVANNSPFQVVWLPDDERDKWLDKVRLLAGQHPGHDTSPIVFEGNAPADIRENDKLRFALATQPVTTPRSSRAWLGAPNSIKGPTEAVFQRQSGNHLLIVGQRDEATLSLLAISLLSLATQFPAGTAKFVLLTSAAPESTELIEQVLAAIPHEVTVARGQDISGVMSELSAEMKARVSGERPADAPPVFLVIHGLHKFKKLRHEDDFSFSSGGEESSPSAEFTALINEGSSHGMHILVTVDTFNNVNRFMSRKALSEFEMRVVFQMSANDSASLIDSPKASGLGLHRALFYNEHDGTLETFRPYATPPSDWMAEAAASFAKA
ncbi:MAG: segregation ATPase, FtsK/SpoIIIE family [Chthoniobacteraceae bacterium]|nr:segregation ATPase, FtsK/SpoIIIE family [Chthoniobacteraceae bacterium]